MTTRHTLYSSRKFVTLAWSDCKNIRSYFHNTHATSLYLSLSDQLPFSKESHSWFRQITTLFLKDTSLCKLWNEWYKGVFQKWNIKKKIPLYLDCYLLEKNEFYLNITEENLVLVLFSFRNAERHYHSFNSINLCGLLKGTRL